MLSVTHRDSWGVTVVWVKLTAPRGGAGEHGQGLQCRPRERELHTPLLNLSHPEKQGNRLIKAGLC